ncbi:MAG: hypothetical protein AAFR79_15035, partial [Pseudomonadota bacterium]
GVDSIAFTAIDEGDVSISGKLGFAEIKTGEGTITLRGGDFRGLTLDELTTIAPVDPEPEIAVLPPAGPGLSDMGGDETGFGADMLWFG